MRSVLLHLDEPTGSFSFQNSGSSGGLWGSSGSIVSGVSGAISNAVSFVDQSAQRFVFGSGSFNYESASDWTAWAWVYPTFNVSGALSRVFLKSYGSGSTWVSPFVSFSIHVSGSGVANFPGVSLKGTGQTIQTTTSATSISNNTWHMLALAVSSSSPFTGVIYVDGTGSTISPGAATDYNGFSGSWMIGGSYSGSNNETFPGYIDEVNYETTQLTPGQILAEYQRVFYIHGPQIVSTTLLDSIHISVVFNEAVDPTRVVTASNYTIIPGLTASSVTYDQGSSTAIITLNSTASLGIRYTLTASGIPDTTGTFFIGPPYNGSLIMVPFSPNDTAAFFVSGAFLSGTDASFAQVGATAFDTNTTGFGSSYQGGVLPYHHGDKLNQGLN